MLSQRFVNELAKRIYVPCSVFVAAAVGSGLVNLALSLVPLVLLLVVTGFPLHATWAFLPVSIQTGETVGVVSRDRACRRGRNTRPHLGFWRNS